MTLHKVLVRLVRLQALPEGAVHASQSVFEQLDRARTISRVVVNLDGQHGLCDVVLKAAVSCPGESLQHKFLCLVDS